MSNQATYVCIEFQPINNIYGSPDCKTWVVQDLTVTTVTPNYVTPALASALIFFALLINVLVLGIKGMKQSF